MTRNCLHSVYNEIYVTIVFCSIHYLFDLEHESYWRYTHFSVAHCSLGNTSVWTHSIYVRVYGVKPQIACDGVCTYHIRKYFFTSSFVMTSHVILPSAEVTWHIAYLHLKSKQRRLLRLKTWEWSHVWCQVKPSLKWNESLAELGSFCNGVRGHYVRLFFLTNISVMFKNV